MTVPDRDETWEALEARVSQLVTKGKRREARDLLQSAIRANAADAPSEAAHFSSVLGSLFLADGKDQDALKAYREAARLDPSDPQFTLTLVNCLVYFLGRPAEALEQVDALLAMLDETDWAYHDARGLRGVALARLGRRPEATAVFESIVRSAERLPASRCDLRLVEEFVSAGPPDAASRSYLDRVLAKAEQERNPDVRERAHRLLAKLPDGSHP
jgi:cytochrome c-type biogenesis protein CcmH/NrfG